MRLAAFLGTLIVGVLSTTSPSHGDDSDPRSLFGDYSLTVARDRVVSGGGGTTGRQYSSAELDALWNAYIDRRRNECLARDPNPVFDHCDVIVTPPGGGPAAAPAAPAISITDLAQFRPVVGELVVEPDGWGVVGTPTNFYATAETHTMDGTLLGAPIQVRWTPSEFRFDYGDGTRETTAAPGDAWGDATWTETSTSHTYTSRDDVTAHLTVVFTAEVNVGSGWFPVPGALPVDAPAQAVKLFAVDTVLTDGDCLDDPSAPGCSN